MILGLTQHTQGFTLFTGLSPVLMDVALSGLEVE